jgi:hypothetical protein
MNEELIRKTVQKEIINGIKKELDSALIFTYIHSLEQENKELQEKINVYEDPEDLTLMFMYCDEKAKDKIKELHNKIDKAIDIIECSRWDNDMYDISADGLNHILKILKGSDVDE